MSRLTTILSVLAVLALLVPAGAGAQPQGPIDFDLNTWSQEGVPDWGQWEVEPDGLTVRQTTNHSPTFFVSPEEFSTATIEGVFEVETGSDDDYIGFVFGYQGPRAPDQTGYDFLVVNWKQHQQSFGGCTAEEGVSLLRVVGQEDPDADYTPGGTSHPALWCHSQQELDDRGYAMDVEVLDTNWGEDTGWEDETEYTFTLDYSPTSVTVAIDGTTVLQADGSFPPGAFGFYNYSQSDVRYSGFAAEEPPEDDRPQADAPGEPGEHRIDAADPVEVATSICGFLADDGTADRVALARNDDFADALAGSSLPGVSCILFTDGGPDAPLNPATRAEIDRALVDGGQIYVLGGVNAVSSAATDELAGAGYDVARLEGPTRFETAAAVARETAQEIGLARDQVIVGYGLDWPDVITAGAYAAATATPIVLTDTATLHPAAAEVIAEIDAPQTVIVGGEAVVGPDVEAAVPNPLRVAGGNRMATATAIAEQLWPAVPATGEDFVFANLERPDAWTLALAAAPLAADIGGPQLGVRADDYPAETSAYLQAQGFTDAPAVVLLGDLSYISEGVATSIASDAFVG